MNKKLTIGQLAKLTGVPTKTIRYYEEVGILPPPERNASRYRLYSEIDIRRLELVRRARVLDMSLPEVRELVQSASSGTCDDFQGRFMQMIQRKQEEVDKKIVDLQQLKRDLKSLEAHFRGSGKEVEAAHAMLECSPETCTCLGSANLNQEQEKEVILWLDKLKSKS